MSVLDNVRSQMLEACLLDPGLGNSSSARKIRTITMHPQDIPVVHTAACPSCTLIGRHRAQRFLCVLETGTKLKSLVYQRASKTLLVASNIPRFSRQRHTRNVHCPPLSHLLTIIIDSLRSSNLTCLTTGYREGELIVIDTNDPPIPAPPLAQGSSH